MNSRTCTLATVLLVALSLPYLLSAQARTAEPADRAPLLGPEAFLLPTGDRFQTSPPKPDRDRVRGALWGGGVGLVAGGVLSGLSVGSSDGDEDFGGSLTEAALTGEAVLLGALFGAAVGALLGATLFAPAHPLGDGVQADSGLSVLPLTSPWAVGLAVRLRR